MRQKKIITFGLIAIMLTTSTFPIIAAANTDDIVTPTLEVVSDEEAQLTIPEEADSVFHASDESVAYQIDEGVVIEGESGEEDLVAPVTIESDIISVDETEVEGVTTVIADLAEAEELVVEEESLNSTIKNFLSPKVYAKDNTTKGTKSDKTLAVKITTTVYWTQYSNGKALVKKVTGGYTKSDSSVSVTSSSVLIGTSADLKNQRKTIALGKASKWTKTNGKDYSFVPVPNTTATTGSVGGANYTVKLARGSSKWSVTYINKAWSKANFLLK